MTQEETIYNWSGRDFYGRWRSPVNPLLLFLPAVRSGQIKEDKDNPGYYDVTGIGYPGEESLGEALYNPYGR